MRFREAIENSPVLWLLSAVGTTVIVTVSAATGALKILNFDIVGQGSYVSSDSAQHSERAIDSLTRRVDSMEALRVVPGADPLNYQLAGYRRLLREGIKEDKLYVIPSIAMVVTLDRDGPHSPIVATQHIAYFTHYLRAPLVGARAFDESYHSFFADKMDALAGADSAIFVEDRPMLKAWNIYMHVDSGQTRSIVTGVMSTYPRKLKSRRTIHYFRHLRANEDAFCYPNTANDVIGSILITVESTTLSLHLRTDADNAGILRNGQYISAPAILHRSPDASGRSVSSRFDDVREGDVVCLRVAW